MDKVDMSRIPHPDSGYFPGLTDALAWVILGVAATLIGALVVGGIWLMLA